MGAESDIERCDAGREPKGGAKRVTRSTIRGEVIDMRGKQDELGGPHITFDVPGGGMDDFYTSRLLEPTLQL